MMAPRGNAVGIDLGTAYSCVGVWRGSDHSVEIIPNEHGNRTTPSVIAFTALERLVGQAALNQIACNPTNTVFDAKRLIGRHFSDNSVQSDKQLWPFQVVAGPHDKPLVRVHFKGHEKCFSPEDISSMVLLKMKAIAEDFLGSDVRKAVVTVPAYFTNVQRRATKSACKAAGLDVLQIMNEPTAAAMAYGLNSRSSSGEHVVVFDLGGGTFDVSVLYIKNKKIIVRAVSGDTHLGGQDFNSRMVAFCIKEFQAKHRLDVSGEAKAVRRLQAACERAKRELSFTVETVIEVPCLHGADDFRATVRRAKFEQLNMDLFDKCLRILNETLTEAGLSKAHIHKVVLVGGSTRIPKIQEMIRDMFGATKLCKTIHPDEAVAFGAAIQAAVLNKDRGAVDIVLRDVTPLSLGISTKGDIMSVIIPRNTPIPVRRERRYVTANPNERSMAIKVVEGDSPDCRYNNYLGGFDLNDLPAAPRCRVSVIVRFDIDANGILNVVAEHKGLGLRKEMCFFSQRDRLDGEEVAEMIAEVERFKFEDRLWKETAELRNQLDMLIYDMKQKAISETLSGNLAAKDSQIIDDGLTAAQNWLSSNESASKAELSRKLKELRLLCADLLVNDPKHGPSAIAARPDSGKTSNWFNRLLG